MSKPSRTGTRLSTNETEVLVSLGEGKTTNEIARLRKISNKTVQSYTLRLRRKLGVKNLSQLIRIGALSSIPEISDSLVAVFDRTEHIEIHFFDRCNKLIGKRRYRAEPDAPLK